MNRADTMMAEWLAEVDAMWPQEDHDRAREAMQKTLAYQHAAFLDALEDWAMRLLRPFARLWR